MVWDGEVQFVSLWLTTKVVEDELPGPRTCSRQGDEPVHGPTLAVGSLYCQLRYVVWYNKNNGRSASSTLPLCQKS